MTEEKVDLLIRCVKECWWRISLLLGLVFGFVLFVLHGWPKGDWAIGWGAVGALATVVVGGIAAHISHTQNVWIAERREFESSRISGEMESAVSYAYMEVAMVRIIINKLEKNDYSLLQNHFSGLDKAREKVGVLLSQETSHLLPKVARVKASDILKKLDYALILASQGFKSKDIEKCHRNLIQLKTYLDDTYVNLDKMMSADHRTLRAVVNSLESTF